MSFMHVAARCRKWETAKNIFNMMSSDFNLKEWPNRANEYTYSVFIDLAGKQTDFKAARKAWEKAKEQKKVNGFVYNCFMQTAALCEEWDTVEAVFNFLTAPEAKPCATRHTYSLLKPDVLEKLKRETGNLLNLLKQHYRKSGITLSFKGFGLLSTAFTEEKFLPFYQQLTPERIREIQQQAWKNLNNPLQPLTSALDYETPYFNLQGQRIGGGKSNCSIYHDMSAGWLPPYGIVKFGRPLKPEQIPLYITDDKNQAYRLDIWGGSRLKSKYREGRFGSAFAIPIQAGEFFQSLISFTLIRLSQIGHGKNINRLMWFLG